MIPFSAPIIIMYRKPTIQCSSLSLLCNVCVCVCSPVDSDSAKEKDKEKKKETSRVSCICASF